MKTKFCVEKNGIEIKSKKPIDTFYKAKLFMRQKMKTANKDDIFEIISVIIDDLDEDTGRFVSYSSRGLNF